MLQIRSPAGVDTAAGEEAETVIWRLVAGVCSTIKVLAVEAEPAASPLGRSLFSVAAVADAAVVAGVAGLAVDAGGGDVVEQKPPPAAGE